VTEAQIRSAFQKRMSGQELTPAEQSAMAAMRQMMQRAEAGARRRRRRRRIPS